jgi:DNA-binding NtrC family response regulator
MADDLRTTDDFACAFAPDEVLLQFEADFVRKILRAANGNVSEAARLARIDRKHFWRLMQRTGVR